VDVIGALPIDQKLIVLEEIDKLHRHLSEEKAELKRISEENAQLRKAAVDHKERVAQRDQADVFAAVLVNNLLTRNKKVSPEQQSRIDTAIRGGATLTEAYHPVGLDVVASIKELIVHRDAAEERANAILDRMAKYSTASTASTSSGTKRSSPAAASNDNDDEGVAPPPRTKTAPSYRSSETVTAPPTTTTSSSPAAAAATATARPSRSTHTEDVVASARPPSSSSSSSVHSNTWSRYLPPGLSIPPENEYVRRMAASQIIPPSFAMSTSDGMMNTVGAPFSHGML
jgi:hypothetical protein